MNPSNKNFQNISSPSILGSSRLSIILSVLFHLIAFIILTFGFHFSRKAPIKEAVYSVDILPIAKISNIESKSKDKKVDAENKLEQKETPKAKAVKEEKKEPEPTIAKEEVKEEAKKEEVKKADAEVKPTFKAEEKKVEKPKKEVAKKEAKKASVKPAKEKSKDDNFDSLLKSLEEQSKPEKNEKTIHEADKTAKGNYRNNLPLSISLEDDIRRQIESCWTPPSGGLNAGKLSILLLISLDKDGSVLNVKVIDKPLGFSTPKMAQAATDAAIRAVKKCSPLRNLPEDEYETWKELEFNFDPSQMIY